MKYFILKVTFMGDFDVANLTIISELSLSPMGVLDFVLDVDLDMNSFKREFYPYVFYVKVKYFDKSRERSSISRLDRLNVYSGHIVDWSLHKEHIA